MSKVLLDAETRYTQLEQLAFSFIETIKKLKLYFQSHSVIMLTSYPLRAILHNPDSASRLMKWSVAFVQYDIKYQPCMALKAHILAYFLVELLPLKINLMHNQYLIGICMWMGLQTQEGEESELSLRLRLESLLERSIHL